MSDLLRNLPKVENIINGPGNRDDKLRSICRFLRDKIEHYDWVGFYLVDTEEGIGGCRLVYNCIKVCPRDVAPGGAIRKMKDMAKARPIVDTEKVDR